MRGDGRHRRYMLLGHAAGIAAALAVADGIAVRRSRIDALHYRLRDQGQVQHRGRAGT